jgi:hypothetical protein
MAKTVPAGLATHLPLDCTTLSTGWKIIRKDGTIVRVTTNTSDVTEDFLFPSPFAEGSQTYQAAEAVSRTNLASTADMDIDNVEIAGIFDSIQFDNEELRRGLFAGAEVLIFAFNYEETGDGAIRMFRGFFGDARVSDQGYFFIELRNIMEVFRRRIGELYSKDCRADLGDKRCRIPISTNVDIFFQDVAPITAYTVGQFLRVPTAPDPASCSKIIMNFEGADGESNPVDPGYENTGTHIDPTVVAATAQIDTAEMPAGGTSISSLLLDGDSDYVSWPDSGEFTMGTEPVTLSCHFRLNATGAAQILASHYSFSGNQRSFLFTTNASDQIEFSVWRTGSTLDITLTGTTTLMTGIDYHAAIVRKNDGDWVLFLDGGIEAGPTTPTGDPFNSTAEWRIGTTTNGVNWFNGWIDSLEFLIGIARWEAPFTPPTGNIVVPTLISEDFGDRIYEVTIAGSSAACTETPDETIGNTHTQGTATLTAEEAWTRAVEVVTVGSSVRREFTVTELTPNSGGTTDGRDFFADDSMNGGAAFWETGNNIGEGMEIRDFVADDGITIEQDIELFRDLPRDIQVGDKLRIFRGCDKLRTTCITIFDNSENAVAEWYVPGMDELGKYPDAR